MTDREFSCILCGRLYIRETPDCIMPEYLICDGCYSELLVLEEPMLSRHVFEKLQGRKLPDNSTASTIVQIIQAKKSGI